MNKSFDYLWNRIKQGDERAFDIVFKELYPDLCNFAFKLLNNLPEAEETAQDAFISLWLNREKIDLKSSLKAYLYQTLHNLAINKLEHFKTNKFRPNILTNVEHWKQIHFEYSVEENFIQAFEAQKTEQHILNAIEQLPEKCREIFLLSRYENLSSEEISEKLKLSQSTIRVQIFRALDCIRKYLKDANRYFFNFL